MPSTARGPRTFIPATDQLPVRARCTIRLAAVLMAVIDSGRAVAAHRLAWWTLQASVNAAAVLLPGVDDLRIGWVGISEHRFAVPFEGQRCR